MIDNAEARHEISDLHSRVVLDMTEIQSVDSSGVSFLVDCRRRTTGWFD